MNIVEQICYLDQIGKLGLPPVGYHHRPHSHSTGREYQVWANLDDESLLVYRVWEWYSPSYEFNDRGKAFGWQVPKEGHPALHEWLAEVPAKYDSAIEEIKAKQKARADAEAEKARTRVERFAKAFGGTYTPGAALGIERGEAGV